MFFLISFVIANNYCVGSSNNCAKVCKNFEIDTFDGIFKKIPTNEELNISNDTIHDVYIAEEVEYLDSNHNYIICDPMIHLIYNNPTIITIRDYIYIDSNIKLKDVPMRFIISNYKHNLTIEVETKEESSIKQFLLESSYPVSLTIKFNTENIQENLITISRNPSNFIVNEVTPNVKKLFNDATLPNQKSLKYYCLSDTEKGCKDYSTFDPDQIKYTNQVTQYPCVLIVDTSNPQILITDQIPDHFNDREYVHIIGLHGSDITYYPKYRPADGEFYVILHPNSIEMRDLYFEGEGSFSLSISANISLQSTSKVNNNNFTIKTKNPYRFSESYIHALREDVSFKLDNKINIPEYSLFTGPKCLSGLFEPGRYLSDEELITYNVTVDSLMETDFDYVTYLFKEGVHEIPRTWKRPCRFQGINPNKTHFIFNDVYSYDGDKIDNFIDVNQHPSSAFNMITVKPANVFYLSSFRSIYRPQYIDRYIIQVEKDFVMHGKGPDLNYDDDEISRDQCKITGNGTIHFTSSNFKSLVQKFCQIDGNITLDTNYRYLTYYTCVGQSSLDECKAEIHGVDDIKNVEWVWLRNLKSQTHLYSYSKIYVTDKQNFFNDNYYDLTLTANAVVTVPYYNIRSFSIYKNRINNLVAQNKTAKVVIVYVDYYDYYYKYTNYYNKLSLHIKYYQQPTEIDFQVYFYYENVKLYMKYLKNYTKNSIVLKGKGQFYIREPYKSIIDIFDYPDSIKFSINEDNNYYQICLSDEPVEDDSLYDFVLCSTNETFKEYDSKSYNANAYIYLDVSLDFNNSYYRCNYFHFYRNTTVSVNLPNNLTFVIETNYFELVFGKRYRFYHTNNKKEANKFIFDIKDYLILNHISVSTNTPLIEFTSSKESVEILPNPSIKNVPDYYTIKMPENFIIYAPVPSYITGLFGPIVEYSKNWTYYHLSEEGKSLYGSFESIPFENYENDENLSENIVLAVGKNDNLTIPMNWTKLHNIYIYQGLYDLHIHKPLNLSYYTNGLSINFKFKIIAGNVNISVPESFTVDALFNYQHYLRHYLFNSILDCSGNSYTNLYTGNVIVYYISEDGYSLLKMYGYNSDNILKIIAKRNSNEMVDIKIITYLYSSYNVLYRFDYDNICYCSNDDDYLSKCKGKYFHIKDLTNLFSSVSDYPELTINVFNDLDISSSTGQYFKFNQLDESVVISLPCSPQSMKTTENQTLLFNYSDSTIYEIFNKSYVDVNLDEPLDILFESNTNSSIMFTLEDDVFVTIDSKCETNFSISVDKGPYHLYTEDFNTYNDIFNGELESYVKICAYDSNALLSCSFSRNDTIQNVFKDPFIYHEVEIALESKPSEITLPPISKLINVNILPIQSSTLVINNAKSIHISPESTLINDYWQFDGDVKVLKMKIEKISTLSIIDELVAPVTFQLTSNQSFIDLKNCDKQNISQVTIIKSGNETNEIIVFGNNDIYNNFINSLVEYEGITIIHNGTQKYMCICNDEESCTRCKEGIEGLITTTSSIQSDPGEDVPIRIFSNIEMSSNLFINEHEVYIDTNCTLNITNVKTVNQDLKEGIKVDNLFFINGTNLLLKPREIALNIAMRKEEKGPYFTIELDTFLRLNVTNSQEENIKSSRLHVEGKGELNTYDYPFERIRPGPDVKVIKGVYIICNPRSGQQVCSYESAYGYLELDHTEGFRKDFDPYSKIVVFLDTFTNIIDANIDFLHQQSVLFVKLPKKYGKLLDGQNEAKVRFNSTNFILSSQNSTELSNSIGGASFDSADLDSIIVGFDDNLTIKQEGDVAVNTSAITIQPMSEKVSIFIDDSVDIDKQKLKIVTNDDKKVSVTIQTNKNITNDELVTKFIESDKNKVIFSSDDPSKNNKKKKGLPVGVIVGIAVGAIVVVSVIVVIILFVVKNKRNQDIVLSELSNQLSDSTF